MKKLIKWIKKLFEKSQVEKLGDMIKANEEKK